MLGHTETEHDNRYHLKSPLQRLRKCRLRFIILFPTQNLHHEKKNSKHFVYVEFEITQLEMYMHLREVPIKDFKIILEFQYANHWSKAHRRKGNSGSPPGAVILFAINVIHHWVCSCVDKTRKQKNSRNHLDSRVEPSFVTNCFLNHPFVLMTFPTQVEGKKDKDHLHHWERPSSLLLMLLVVVPDHQQH